MPIVLFIGLLDFFRTNNGLKFCERLNICDRGLMKRSPTIKQNA